MKKLLAKIRKLLRDRRTRRIITRFVSVTAAIVVFVTTYALVLPAITMELEAKCGIPAHQHTSDCYEEQLVCGEVESPGHHHGEECYTSSTVLVCESEEHVHEDACYDENGELVCEKVEHVHSVDGGCYEEVKELTCEIPESDGHEHTADCYKKVLTCGLEVHTHSAACYESDSTAADTAEAAVEVSSSMASTGAASVNNDDSDDNSFFENSATEWSEDASTALTIVDNAAAGVTADGHYVLELAPINFSTVLNDHTGIYYHTVADGETVEDSAQISATEWNRMGKNTELGKQDLLRVYLAYSIPAGSLNTTNQTARYRLPANLHLTDSQVKAINETVNGIAGQYVDMSTLEILDTEKYYAYLGVEAVEGMRTPDQDPNQYLADLTRRTGDGSEYISALVRVENVYDEQTGDYLGQDLVVTFTPYSIEKNQHEYDSTGQPTKAGQEIDGWVTLDFNLSQVDLIETAVDTFEREIETTVDAEAAVEEQSVDDEENVENNNDEQVVDAHPMVAHTVETVERREQTADVVFVAEGRDENGGRIHEISMTLTVVEETVVDVQTVEDQVEGAPVEGTTEDNQGGTISDGEATGDTTVEGQEPVEDPQNEKEEEQYQSGTLTAEGDGYRITLDYTADAKIPADAKLEVSEITAESNHEAYEACLEQARASINADDASEAGQTVDKKATRFFDIEIQMSMADENGQEKTEKVEPAAPVSVNIQLENTDATSSSATGSDNKSSAVNEQAAQDPTILHFAEEGVERIESTTVEAGAASGTADASDSGSPTDETAQDTTEIQFQAESFSIYGVVYKKLVTDYITASGDAYEVSVYYDDKAGIPEDAELVVKEITSEDTAYAALYEKAEDILKDKYSAMPEDVAPETASDIEKIDTDDKAEADIYEGTNADLEKEAENLNIADNGKSNAESSETENSEEHEQAQEVDSKEQETYIHKALFLDIKIISEGQEIEPKDTVKISIIRKNDKILPMIKKEDGQELFALEEIVHYVKPVSEAGLMMDGEDDELNTDLISGLAVVETDNGVEVSFETDSFSHYGTIQAGYMCVIQPGDTVTLESQKEGGTWAVANDEHSNVTVSGNSTGATANANSGIGIATVTHTYTENGKTETETFKVRVATKTGTTPPTITTVTNNEANIVRMRLLDFDLLGVLDDESNSGGVNNNNQYVFNQSINVGHSLKFLGWGASASTDWINTYAGVNNQNAYRPVQNIVAKGLVEGYPVLSDQTSHSGESLNYIFNKTEIANDKKVYENAEGLFRLTDDLYYEYNSNANYAYYDENTSSFSVYDRTYYQQASGRKAIGFFPFDPPTNAYYSGNNNGRSWTNETTNSANSFITNFNDKPNGYTPYLPDKYYLNPCTGAGGSYNNGRSAGYWNHHLGINMAVDFNIRKDGKNADGNESIFRFNGDDDMWVFVDGKLALDIGGLHQPINGTINFTTGECLVQSDESGTMVQQTNIYTLFNKQDFIDLDKPHRLEVFYLERGGCDSNCRISFNMKKEPPKYGTIHLTKTTPNYVPVPGATFQLFYDAACTQPLRRTIDTEASIRAGFDVGDYDYARDDVTAVSDTDGYVRFPKVLTGEYYMKEVSVPEGYWANNAVYKVVVGEDPRVEAGEELNNEEPDPYTQISASGSSSAIDDLNVVNDRVIIDVKKVDNNGTPLPGAVFQIAFSPAVGSTASAKTFTETVGNSGVITLDGSRFLPDGQHYDVKNDVYGLPSGTYTVTETQAPTGYQAPANPSFSFTVNNGVLTGANTQNGISFNNETKTFEVINTLPPNKLGVTKKWLDYDGNSMDAPQAVQVKLKQWIAGSHHLKLTVGSTVLVDGDYSGEVTVSWNWTPSYSQYPTSYSQSISGINNNYEFNITQTTSSRGYMFYYTGASIKIFDIDRDYNITINQPSISFYGNTTNYPPDTGTLRIDSNGGGSSDYDATGNEYTLTLGGTEPLSKQLTVTNDANPVYEDGKLVAVPGFYNGKTAYYTVEEITEVTDYEVTVSQEYIHDQGTLLVTNQSTVQEHPVDLNIQKTDESGAGLAGAVFQVLVKNSQGSYQPIAELTGADLTKYQGISTSSGPLVPKVIGAKNGSGGVEKKSTFTTTTAVITLTGLPDGEYQLVEVESPEGYVLTLKPIEFTVANGAVTYDATTTNNAGNVAKVTPTPSDGSNVTQLAIANEPGFELPSSGGPGTKLIYLAGSLLTLLGVVMLMGKKIRA